MAKKVLCVDLGNVLIEFTGKPVADLIKKEKIKDFVDSSITKHDTDELHLWSLYQHMKKDGFFSGEVLWENFVGAYSLCLNGIHMPMYHALADLKQRGVNLVCITDNNHFMFSQTTIQYTLIFPLFRKDGVDQFVLSHDIHSLKRNGTPFTHASSVFGFSPSDACFVDDQPYNIEAAVKIGYDRDACFLYKINRKRNHEQFLKFLDKHFPAK
ncbi:MAG: hypothetical protein Q7S12_02130 [bacterium]|nr:hypothetical protein [bacterium]